MKNYRLLIAAAISAIFFVGCADIEVPNPERILDDAGARQIKLGMSQPEVISIYGEPTIKDTVSSVEWGGAREEWIYRADIAILPVNAGYLSSDLYLYFDDGRLTNISREPLGEEQGSIENVEKSVK